MFTARARHVEDLRAAQTALVQAEMALTHEAYELVAEHLKGIHQHLASMVGERTHDDVLSEIFSTFCIGK